MLEGGLDVDVVTDVCELSGVFGEQLSRRRKFRRVRFTAPSIVGRWGCAPKVTRPACLTKWVVTFCCMVTRQQTATCESIE